MGYKLVLRIILLMLDYSVDIPGITVCRAFHVLLMSQPNMGTGNGFVGIGVRAQSVGECTIIVESIQTGADVHNDLPFESHSKHLKGASAVIERLSNP